ncbi:proteasome accessory factor PafA2 family protein [Candidatus Woesearchaeota archaeon]|nr:proteasome accessory factor PafA2 family protein [Candidatus Woesearchaeota archaeon]
MNARICGEETEYGGAFISDKGLAHRLSDKYIDNLLLQTDRETEFLKNGARIYRDNQHVEYATPECTSPLDVLVYSKAGERILNTLAKKNTTAFEGRTSKRLNGRVRFFRHNTDGPTYYNTDASIDFYAPATNTFGCHENYSFDTEKLLWDQTVLASDADVPGPEIPTMRALHTLYNHLLPFLITRPIWAGNGNLAVEGGRYVYQLSQRIPHINKLNSEISTSERGLFNFRNVPLALYLGRLHLICGDANMSEYQTYLKYGVTGIVLGMIEDGYKFDNLHFKDCLSVLYAINHNLNFHEAYEMRLGRAQSPLDIQRTYLQAAKTWMAAKQDLTLCDVVDAWEETLAMLDENDPAVERRLDWAAKRRLIMQKSQREPDASSKLTQINLQYHDIDPVKSLYYALVNHEEMETLIDEEDIQRAMEQPPNGSRARTRQAILDYFATLRNTGVLIECEYVQWDRISYSFRINDLFYERVIELPSPYDTSVDSIEEINTTISQFR